MKSMKSWFRFFFGTPRRFVATTLTLVAGMIAVHVSPGFLRRGVEGLVNELAHLRARCS